jgi:hypothetical protein
MTRVQPLRLLWGTLASLPQWRQHQFSVWAGNWLFRVFRVASIGPNGKATVTPLRQSALDGKAACHHGWPRKEPV